MKRLVFIIGLPRSGTSFLGEKLKDIDDSIYFEEPNYIWMYKNMHKGHDCLDKSDLSVDKISYIRDFFYKRNESTIIEKTPSNVLRLTYIFNIFPEAKYIYIRRSLCDVKNSIEKKWLKEEDNNNELVYGNKSSQKFRQFKIQIKKFLRTPPVDLYYYIPKILQEACFLLLGRQRRYWGPRIPNYMNLIEDFSVNELINIQVDYCSSTIENDISIIPPEQLFTLDFQDLKSNTDECVAKVKEFINSK